MMKLRDLEEGVEVAAEVAEVAEVAAEVAEVAEVVVVMDVGVDMVVVGQGMEVDAIFGDVGQ
jgi:hypothetical protein